ncbi:MAG TPA: T9SS type A sorting domain-containing protein [Candidatus Krumholzibacteria bacterium]|nr:T9SS type A sorting domain-containing protein [Candidatus Krumholzibacteria bacterium]
MFAPVANAGDPCGDDVACVSPGRVAFAVAPNGTWKFFGPSNDRSFIKKGGVLVYALSKGSDSEILDATGGVRSLLEAPMAPVQEGARGGAREPFPRPDDDYDGHVDEDPLDRIDNDGDGRIDEDFAAIGDAMTVALYGPKNDSGLQIRQELYAWTLPHIDAMVATAITLRAGSAALEGVRLGVFVETDGFEREAAPLIEAEYLGAASRTPRDEVLVWRDGGRGMALLLWAPSTSEDWEVREDKSGTRALSPSLGTLAANASTTIYAALIALPPDDLRSARAIQAAWRTLAGSKGTHLMPPPVSVTKRDEPATHETHEPATIGSPYGSVMSSVVYWNTPGKLTPSLLVGSPNPFRDTIAIDYEVPETVVDEHKVQHQLSGEAVETSVKVYNVTGRLIATLVESPHGPGRYRTGWSAQDDQGATVASGVYYVKLTIGRQSVTQRLVQLK